MVKIQNNKNVLRFIRSCDDEFILYLNLQGICRNLITIECLNMKYQFSIYENYFFVFYTNI